MSGGKQDTDLKTPPVFYNLRTTCPVEESASDICVSCLTTVPPRGTDAYNRREPTRLAARKGPSGECRASFFALKRFENKEWTLHCLEETHGVHVSAR